MSRVAHGNFHGSTKSALSQAFYSSSMRRESEREREREREIRQYSGIIVSGALSKCVECGLVRRHAQCTTSLTGQYSILLTTTIRSTVDSVHLVNSREPITVITLLRASARYTILLQTITEKACNIDVRAVHVHVHTLSLDYNIYTFSRIAKESRCDVARVPTRGALRLI